MQSQEQSHQRPDSLPPDKRAINVDPREQPQEQIRQQEDTDRSYEQGYSALDEPESWSRQGEKLRPRSRPLESKVWSLLLVALLCTVFIVAGLLGLILNWLSWLLVIAVLIAWLARVTSNRHVTMRTLPPSTFQVMEHAQLNLRNHSGNVLLRRGEEGSINVAATIHARSLDYANMPVRYDQHGDSLTISSRFSWNSLFFGSSTVDFEITVPANCDVHLSNESGRVVLQGISGDIRVHADNASIETDNVQGQIILKTDHGSIQASNLQGQALLQTDHGSIEAHDLQGRITLKTDHGNIETSNLQGQIHLQTDHGNIAANGLRGSAKLKTDKGNISVGQSSLIGPSRLLTDAGSISFDGTLDPTGDYEIRTDRGTIAVTLPPDASFYLDAKTDVGSITTNFPLTSQHKRRISASVGNGPSYPRLRLKTDMGSINLLHR